MIEVPESPLAVLKDREGFRAVCRTCTFLGFRVDLDKIEVIIDDVQWHHTQSHGRKLSNDILETLRDTIKERHGREIRHQGFGPNVGEPF